MLVIFNICTLIQLLILKYCIYSVSITTLQRALYITTILIVLFDGFTRIQRRITLKDIKKYFFLFIYILIWTTILCVNIFYDWDYTTLSIRNWVYMICPGIITFALYLYIKKDFPKVNKTSAYTKQYLVFQILHITLIAFLYILGCIFVFLFPINILIPYWLIVNTLLALEQIWVKIRTPLWFYKKAYIEKIQLFLIKDDIDQIKTPCKNFLMFINTVLNTYFIRKFGFNDINNILKQQLKKRYKDLVDVQSVQSAFQMRTTETLMKRKFDNMYLPHFVVRYIEDHAIKPPLLKRRLKY